MTILISLICILIALIIFVIAYYLSKHVVEKQHRVNVLEDAYREATDEIQALTQTVQDKDREIELIMFEAQQNGQRMDRPRSWNPSDPLNSTPRQ